MLSPILKKIVITAGLISILALPALVCGIGTPDPTPQPPYTECPFTMDEHGIKHYVTDCPAPPPNRQG